MNYTLIAKLDHTPNGNFVTSFEEEDHFEKYNTMDSWCEHCKKRIYRKISYIFRDENGNEVQVGTSCINHYLGEEPSMEEEIILRSSHSDFAAGLEIIFQSGAVIEDDLHLLACQLIGQGRCADCLGLCAQLFGNILLAELIVIVEKHSIAPF